MKIILLTVGKTQTGYIKEATEGYIRKVCHYMPLEMISLPDIKTSKTLSEEERKLKEGESILASLNSSDRVVLLDEKGTEYTSREFAGFIEKQSITGLRRLVFVVGGPYGFSKDVKSRADSLISLSRMTFSHEMVRLFFAEQVYRAMTILRGEPYHHD
ncbi:MAG: 23S rRNA (pseudouridine(1915)-N(3))-methyltransferase RlmH [Paramuribaculum sp.]|nr:23S rRNA (pseudouridine(1915)-N(3))-methyltransferase RlmH [Paramuribaculum sp.]